MPLPLDGSQVTLTINGAIGIYTSRKIDWESGDVDLTGANPGAGGMGRRPDPAKAGAKIEVVEIKKASGSYYDACTRNAIITSFNDPTLTAQEVTDLNAMGPFYVGPKSNDAKKSSGIDASITLISSGGVIAGTTVFTNN